MNKKIILFVLLLVFSPIVAAQGIAELSTYDSSGDGLQDVRIDVSGPEETVAYTDSRGKVEISNLDQGSYSVEASKSGYDNAESSFSIDYSGDRENVELTLSEGSDITGRVEFSVSDQNGNPIDARVEIDGPSETVAYSGEDGSNTVRNLKEGSYTIKATKNGQQSNQESFSIDYEGDIETVDFTINVEEDTEDPVARLDIDPDQAETGEEVTFDASGSSDNEGIIFYKFTYRDGEAGAEISNDPVVTRSFSEPGEYTASLEVEDTSGNTDTVEEDFEVIRSEGSLKVIVEDDEGDRLENAEVEVDSNVQSTNEDGETTFDLPLDDYTVQATCDGETESQNVELNEAEEQVSIDFDFSSETNVCGEEAADPDFQVSITDDNSPVEEGEELEIGYEVENEGARQGTQDIELKVKGEVRDSEEISLYPAESDEGSLSWNTEESDEGSYDAEVSSENSTDSVEVQVGSGIDQRCGISRRDIVFSLEDYVIHRGESTEARLSVVNNADAAQDVEIVFKEGSSVVSSEEASISGGSEEEFTREVSPNRDSFIRAQVKTEGDPCGQRTFDFAKELIVLSDTSREATLDVEVTDEDDHPIRNARVEVDGPEDRVRYTDSFGETEFSLRAGDYDVEVTHPDYESEEDSVSLSEGEREDLRFELERIDEDREDGTFQAFVEDGDTGDRIEDARVEIDGPEDRVEYTSWNGFASFRVEEGRYDVEVTHPDYESTSTDTVYIEEDETTTRTFRLYREDDDRRGIEIVNTDYSGSVCRGGTLSVDVTVDNRDNRDEFVTVTGTGLGSNIVLDGFVVEEGEREQRRVRFTNVEGSGRETFRIQARNGTRDSVSRSVRVEDCVPSQPPTQDPSGISMKLSYPISPNKALVGDTVKVSGFVDGVNRRTEVEIDVDGDRKARVSTQPDGYYQTYIRADSVGMKTVRARAGGQSASRQLHVLPTANVGLVEAPRKAFEGETFEVCTEVQSQVEAKVILLEDGRLIQSTNDRGRVCFDVEAQDPGKHVYEVRALTAGEGSSSKATVEVLETDVEVESFPDQVASVESGSGMIKVDLYNTKNQMTRYNLNVEGLPSTWLSQSEKQVVLSPGERKEVFFYLTPRDEGTYDPEVIVEARNQEIFRQTVDLETGGQNAPRERGLVQKLRDVFSF